MPNTFPPVEIDDPDGSTTRIEVTTEYVNWTQCVRITCRARETFNKAHGWHTPDDARALARALLEAADEAELRQLEADTEAAELDAMISRNRRAGS